MPVDDAYSRANVYEDDDGRIVYRASSLGSCAAALVRARLGVTPSAPPDLMLERFQEGHDWEAEVIAAGMGVDWVQVTMPDHLQLYGKVVEDQAGLQVETELTWSNKIVRCHPDAIAVHRHSGERVVVEAKFFGEDLAAETIAGVEKLGMLGLGATRAWQTSIEMLSTGLPMLYIVGTKKIEGTGENRKVVGLDGPPTVWEWQDPCYELVDVKMRVAEIEGYVARGEMPACSVPFDYPCGYWAEHVKVERQELTDERLVLLVEDYERCLVKRDGVASAIEGIRADIDARLGELGVEAGRVKGWAISMTANRPGNVSWAKWAKAVKKKHPEVSDVEEDEFRGDEVAGGIRMEKVK